MALAVGYIRTSTDEQALSLDVQRNAIEEYLGETRDVYGDAAINALVGALLAWAKGEQDEDEDETDETTDEED